MVRLRVHVCRPRYSYSFNDSRHDTLTHNTSPHPLRHAHPHPLSPCTTTPSHPPTSSTPTLSPQVPDVSQQHRVMIEAVENHMPEVVIVDEIGTEEEALACRTIAERGVMLIGTAHGQLLENLIKNPTLTDLVGGISSVTLSGE